MLPTVATRPCAVTGAKGCADAGEGQEAPVQRVAHVADRGVHLVLQVVKQLARDEEHAQELHRSTGADLSPTPGTSFSSLKVINAAKVFVNTRNKRIVRSAADAEEPSMPPNSNTSTLGKMAAKSTSATGLFR